VTGTGFQDHGVSTPRDVPRVALVGGWWSEKLGERFSETRDGLVCGGVGDAEGGAELLHGEVVPVGEDDKESPVGER
jgi:hypothetical protein